MASAVQPPRGCGNDVVKEEAGVAWDSVAGTKFRQERERVSVRTWLVIGGHRRGPANRTGSHPVPAGATPWDVLVRAMHTDATTGGDSDGAARKCS